MITHSPVNLGIAKGCLLEYKTISALQLKLLFEFLTPVRSTKLWDLELRANDLMLQIIGEVGQRQRPCASSKGSIRCRLGLRVSRVQLFLKADLD